MNTNPIPELAPQLKQLRLSGILDSLGVAQPPGHRRPSWPTPSSWPCWSATRSRGARTRSSACRLRRAQFRTTKTLEQFEFERLPRLNRALVHDLATGRYLHEKAPVLIVGPSGIGKSHLAQALGHCAVRQGVDVVVHLLRQRSRRA